MYIYIYILCLLGYIVAPTILQNDRVKIKVVPHNIIVLVCSNINYFPDNYQ